jgi:hypothetical protein
VSNLKWRVGSRNGEFRMGFSMTAIQPEKLYLHLPVLRIA